MTLQDMNISRCVEILERVLDLSVLQRRYLEEGKLPDFINCRTERERLFTELKDSDLKNFRTESIKELSKKIMVNDDLLTSNISAVMNAISMRLEKIKNSSKAIKAYTTR